MPPKPGWIAKDSNNVYHISRDMKKVLKEAGTDRAAPLAPSTMGEINDRANRLLGQGAADVILWDEEDLDGQAY